MENYLLKIEGLNFGSFLFDTEDLSTIRGGSLALADAVKLRIPGLKQVSETASSTLWTFSAEDDKVKDIVAQAHKHLASGAASKHGTFSIACLKLDKEISPTAIAQVDSTVRRSQLANAGLVYPEIETTKQSGKTLAQVCEIDFSRPAAMERTYGSGALDHQEISHSVHDRRQLGMEKKQSLLKRLIVKILPRKPLNS